jgi:anti-anti-sigma factor
MIQELNKDNFKKETSLLIKLPFTDFDEINASIFKKTVTELMIKHPSNALILDFSNVSFSDADGIASITYLWRICSNKNMNMFLCGMNNALFSIINTKGIDKIIEVVDTYKQALQIQEKNDSIREYANFSAQRLEDIFGNIFENTSEKEKSNIVNLNSHEERLQKVL